MIDHLHSENIKSLSYGWLVSLLFVSINIGVVIFLLLSEKQDD